MDPHRIYLKFIAARRGIPLALAGVAVTLVVGACDRDADDSSGRDARPTASAAQPATEPGMTPARTTPDTAPGDWSAVDAAMGRAGTAQPGGVHKYGFPRSDLQVRVGNVVVKPVLALGGWVAFSRAGGDAMAMGDLVLRESEVVPVMTKLQAMGVRQTALHNHLEGESPRVMYMHIEGRGDPVKIAGAVRSAIALTGTPAAAAPGGGAKATAIGIDTAAVAAALGHHGKVTGGVYQVSVPRAEPITMDGMAIPPAMGVATGLNFQPTGGGKAAVTGDFVLTAAEVNPVIQTLGEHGIAVTALHSHMLMEQPRLFFMHFWAHDDAVKLAQGLGAALGKMSVKQ
jgi:hypothetical protein